MCLAFPLQFIELLRFTQFGMSFFCICSSKVYSSTGATSDLLPFISAPYSSYSSALVGQAINSDV